MWPFNRRAKDFNTQATIVAPMLVGCCQKAAPGFLTALVGEEDTEAKVEVLDSLTIELLVFSLHLSDRITFGRLGDGGRSAFMKALLPQVRDMLEQPFSSHLQDLYNSRNTFYGGCKKLAPEKNESLKGTLFWEFGKAMGSVYSNSNPVAITQTAMDCMSFMSVIDAVLAEANVI